MTRNFLEDFFLKCKAHKIGYFYFLIISLHSSCKITDSPFFSPQQCHLQLEFVKTGFKSSTPPPPPHFHNPWYLSMLRVYLATCNVQNEDVFLCTCPVNHSRNHFLSSLSPGMLLFGFVFFTFFLNTYWPQKNYFFTFLASKICKGENFQWTRTGSVNPELSPWISL